MTAPVRHKGGGIAGYARSCLTVSNQSGESGHFIRFFGIGCLTTLLDLGMLFALTSGAGLFYLVSACISYITGCLASFMLNKSLNFHDTSRDYGKQLFVFIGISIMGLAINLLVMYGCVGLLGFHYLISKIAATGTGFLMNYLGQSRVTFRLWRGP
jgi:putative flippase GtrA